MAKFRYDNILLTGAAGALGNQLRESLSQASSLLRSSDREDLIKKFKNEEVIKADLS